MNAALAMRRDCLVSMLPLYGALFRVAEALGHRELDMLVWGIDNDVKKIVAWLRSYDANSSAVVFCYSEGPTWAVMGAIGEAVVDEYDMLNAEYKHLLRVTKMERQLIFDYRVAKYPVAMYPLCFHDAN